MKQSTAKFIRNAGAGIALISVGTILLAICYHYWLPSLTGAICTFGGIVWLCCGTVAKWRSCRQLTGYNEPLNLQHNPMPLDCPPAPCCCASQPEDDNANEDNPDVGCRDVMRCEL
jgi:hypothetical protein